MITVKRLRFTPQRAQAEQAKTQAAIMSGALPFAQRRLASSAVARYQGAMTRGEWFTETGETVKFANIPGHGWVMIDGQTRMEAVSRANIPVMMYAAFGVDPKAFFAMDQGRPRSVVDTLTVAMWPNAGVCATAGRMLWKEDSTGNPFEKPDGTDALGDGAIAKAIDDNYRPALLMFVANHKPMLNRAQARGTGGAGWLAFIGLRIAAIDPTAWDPILSALADPSVQVPHAAWGYAMDYIRETRRKFEAESPTGKLLMGRNKDLSDLAVRAYRAAWQFQRDGRRCSTVAAIKNAERKLEQTWVPFA